MSDTPRTDAKRSGDKHFMGDWVNANFACQLERELNAANAIIRQQQLLDEENFRLQERINRLEEENDALRADLLLWREAKP